MHFGRVGGGTKGFGKTSFLAWSDHRPINVVDASGGIREGLLVMPIQGFAATRPADSGWSHLHCFESQSGLLLYV